MADGGYLEHKTVAGDRWDMLAWKYYGDASKQTILLEANRELYLEPIRVPDLILAPGITLKVPVLEAEQVALESDLPPWKRGGGGEP
ncbi:Phage Tail Protein X [Pelagimonas phthalicica]|uniref:Phage Tail Protein X n=1 Tax=Pelagimonas phthalicica TaxID=1037362 RepID=A0A238JFH5_9RHOB|nr:tail protein X [Pelagimonas phthalicica]TDS92115.1 tail protein X [Pelagimonas phthalicica]SMX29165.1 Phage Tail Protein X [Pelagimonas phthalicica]